MPKPKTQKKKRLTLEEFAGIIQRDLVRMATKDDIAALRDDMATKEDIRKVREEMATKEQLADVADRISVAKEELQKQIAGLHYAKEIDELRSRVNVLEEKLGVKPTRRAA